MHACVCSLLAMCWTSLLYNLQSTARVLVGNLPTLAHRVSGRLYIEDERTLFIENFNYDGAGPGELATRVSMHCSIEVVQSLTACPLFHIADAFHYYYEVGVTPVRTGGGIILYASALKNNLLTYGE